MLWDSIVPIKGAPVLVMKGFEISKLSGGEFSSASTAMHLPLINCSCPPKLQVAVADDQIAGDSKYVAAAARTLCRA